MNSVPQEKVQEGNKGNQTKCLTLRTTLKNHHLSQSKHLKKENGLQIRSSQVTKKEELKLSKQKKKKFIVTKKEKIALSILRRNASAKETYSKIPE